MANVHELLETWIANVRDEDLRKLSNDIRAFIKAR